MLNGIRVGTGAKIGANAAVATGVPDEENAVGISAQILDQRVV